MQFTFLSNAISYIRQHKKQTGAYFLVGLVFVFLVIFIWQKAFSKDTAENQENAAENTISTTDNAVLFTNPLTGLVVDTPMELPSVYGVMIDHSSDAWPQAGIDRAFLVIEAPVEGGIPRLLSFFDSSEEVEKIGPVRSARPYFIDWNNEFDALYTHVGGSDAALQRLATGGTLDLNQFWNGATFWRDNNNRYAPHNVYTSSNLLGEAHDSITTRRKLSDPLYGVWTFSDSLPDTATKPAESVKLSFGSFTYTATWVYTKETESYSRLQAGQLYKTDTGKQITAENVVLLKMDVAVIDAVGRRSIDTISEGEAIFIRDGVQIKAVWKKTSESERTRLYTENGEEISFHPGRTWFEVLDNEDWNSVVIE